MSPKKERRRKLFVDKRIQGMLALMYIVIAVLVVLLIGIELMRAFYAQMGWPGGEKPIQITDYAFVFELIIFLIIGGLLFWVFSAYAGHRIAGPLYRLNKSLISFSRGDYGLRIKFRKKDYFKELAANFNRMAENTHREIKKKEQIVAILEKLLPELPQNDSKVKDLKDIIGDFHGGPENKAASGESKGTD